MTTTTGERTRIVRQVIGTMAEPFALAEVQTEVARRDPRAVSCVSAVLTHDANSGRLLREGPPRRYVYRRAECPLLEEPRDLASDVATLLERVAALERTLVAVREAFAAMGRA